LSEKRNKPSPSISTNHIRLTYITYYTLTQRSRRLSPFYCFERIEYLCFIILHMRYFLIKFTRMPATLLLYGCSFLRRRCGEYASRL
jgi:hypothetical protein